MPNIDKYEPGTFCWVELTTTDDKAANAFYSELFGWSVTSSPVPPDGVYNMYTLKDRNVCASFKMRAEMQKAGVPSHWGPYVSVASADETVKRATELGAKVVMPAFDVMDVGRMAVIADPTGAVFSIWQPKKHLGAQILNEPGAVCWNELYTKDTAAASKFYTALFGWNTVGDSGPMPYTQFNAGKEARGGMMAIKAEWGPVPSHWVTHFATADCDATVERAKKMGAKVVTGPDDVPEVGRFAVLFDPQGAEFAVIKLNEKYANR